MTITSLFNVQFEIKYVLLEQLRWTVNKPSAS